jgi:clathrin heavy chain
VWQHIGKVVEHTFVCSKALKDFNALFGVDLISVFHCNLGNDLDVLSVRFEHIIHAIPEEQIIDFFARLSEEDTLQCMYDMLKSNRQNVQIVAKIAVKYTDKIDTKKSIEVLESFGTNEGMLYYLANVLPHTEDPDIYFKYIEACARLGNFKEVERVIKETSNYDPEKVKDFLKDAKLPDPRPLIYLCDKHNFIEELTRYLYTNK